MKVKIHLKDESVLVRNINTMQELNEIVDVLQWKQISFIFIEEK